MQILDFFHTTFAIWFMYLSIGIFYANHVIRWRKSSLNEYEHRLNRYMYIRNTENLTIEQKQHINKEIKQLDEEFAVTVKIRKQMSVMPDWLVQFSWICARILTIITWPVVWIYRRF